MTNKFTSEQIDFITKNYKNMAYKEIGEKIGRSEKSVNDKIRKLNLLKTNKIAWSKKEEELLVKEYNRIPNIYELFPNRSRSSIAYKAHSLGLKKMNRGNFKVDVDFFKTWTNEMSYILGLIAADGNVITNPKVLTIVLHRQDRYMLENVKKIMKSERNISKRKSNCDTFVIRCGTIVDDLMKLGILPAKSLKLQWIEVPNTYLKDFIRGYIDGDGCVSYYQRNRYNKTELVLEVSILGTEDFLTGMTCAINKEIGLKVMKTHKPKGFINGKEFRNISRIKYSGKSACKLLDWLYEDAKLFLNRKKDKYAEYLENR